MRIFKSQHPDIFLTEIETVENFFNLLGDKHYWRINMESVIVKAFGGNLSCSFDEFEIKKDSVIAYCDHTSLCDLSGIISEFKPTIEKVHSLNSGDYELIFHCGSSKECRISVYFGVEEKSHSWGDFIEYHEFKYTYNEDYSGEYAELFRSLYKSKPRVTNKDLQLLPSKETPTISYFDKWDFQYTGKAIIDNDSGEIVFYIS